MENKPNFLDGIFEAVINVIEAVAVVAFLVAIINGIL